MTVQAAACAQPFRGLRRLDPTRDLGQVADLIEAAFPAEPDGAEQGAIRDLRALDRSRFMVWLLARVSAEFQQALSGFVWIECGRVVGNASITREDALGLRWMLSSVAVHPAYRGRGIARRLVQESIEYAEGNGGRWVELLVEQGNSIAVALYEHMAFVALEGLSTFRCEGRGAASPEDGRSPLRRLTRRDQGKVAELAREATPQNVQRVRPVLAERFANDFSSGLSVALATMFGQSVTERWGIEEEGRLVASIRVRREPRGFGRADLLVAPDARGRYESLLVTKGLSLLAESGGKPSFIDVSTRDAAAMQALRAHGCAEVRTLTRMVRELRPA